MRLDNLREIIKIKKLTFAELEKILGFGNGTIRKWEDNSPSINKVNEVACYLNVSVDYLLCNTDDPTPPEKKMSFKRLPDIKWGDFGISFYEGNKKLTQSKKDKIAKIAQIIISEDEEQKQQDE